ncbi:hypothetical protein HZS_3690 [Henneguya salminicola]|nr:hypothetical protein HZS_3690 [Henneguya salminicola]
MLLKYNCILKLITSIRHESPDSQLHDCYFHLKQSFYKKLKKFKISLINSKIVVDKIELLTLISHCNIVKGIQYIKTLTTVDDNQGRFWVYFENTWLKMYEPCLRDTYLLNDDDAANRTNNALERYNPRLKDPFSNAHPNLACLIQTQAPI